MGKVTISAIKADVGGYVGHSDVHPEMLAEAESRVRKGIAKGLLIVTFPMVHLPVAPMERE